MCADWEKTNFLEKIMRHLKGFTGKENMKEFRRNYHRAIKRLNKRLKKRLRRATDVTTTT